jgi:hypothetical protein
MIDEDEARALWRRAAELQVIAENRDADRQPLASVRDDESALTVDEIVTAAEGAGIAAEYVLIALVERSLPNAGWSTRRDWVGLLGRLAGYESEAVERVVLIQGTRQSVLDSLSKLLSRHSYGLTLERTVGDDAAGGGVLVYRLANPMRKKFAIHSASAFERDINIADGKYLLVTLREADDNAVRLSIRMPLFRRGDNVALFTIFAAASGWLGTTLGSYIGSWLSMPSVLSALMPGVVGAAGMITGGLTYRGIYRWATKKGEAAVERLLQAVSVGTRGTTPRSPPLDEK